MCTRGNEMEENKILDSFREMNILIKKKLFKIAKKNGNIKPPSPLQVKILIYLCEHKNEDVCLQNLVSHLKPSKVAISEAVIKLEKSGLITRTISRNDGRSKIIKITDKAISKIGVIKNDADILNDIIINRINKDDLEVFFRVMNSMQENLRKDD